LAPGGSCADQPTRVCGIDRTPVGKPRGPVAGEQGDGRAILEAALLPFRLSDRPPMEGPGGTPVWDKVPMSFPDEGEPVPANRLPRAASAVWNAVLGV
jgi:hypothetical protein